VRCIRSHLRDRAEAGFSGPGRLGIPWKTLENLIDYRLYVRRIELLTLIEKRAEKADAPQAYN
jgi:hypothetical protein